MSFRIPSISPEFPGPVTGRSQIRLWVNPSVDTIMARKIIRSYDPGRRGRYLYNDTNMYLIRLIA